MKQLMMMGLTSVLAFGQAGDAFAAVSGLPGIFAEDGGALVARQGRGRGHGGNGSGGHGSNDNSTDDNSNGGSSGSGRSKPRVPGGSGCDDAGDIAEHSECSA
ncbi:MAG: hypothetical protein R3D97_14710 [Paracoccaceae bacterium]